MTDKVTGGAGEDDLPGTGPADEAVESAELTVEEILGAGSGGEQPATDGEDLAAQLAERTADVQRVQAEYANYRRRVERDRETAREATVGGVLAELLPVLDDIGRAREHEELTGGFKSVAESLEATVAKLGLEAFGEAGDPFDPSVHEALSHTHSPDVTETTCIAVLQRGYRHGGRIVRPALVAVADPEPGGQD